MKLTVPSARSMSVISSDHGDHGEVTEVTKGDHGDRLA